jgi:hypothetical protein
MRIPVVARSVFVLLFCLAAVPAFAQYGVQSSSGRATGENYHVEVGGFLWPPDPTVVIRSESLGILGDQIDFVDDLGIEKDTFRQIKVVLRPATKHKFRFEYTPISYDAEAVIRRDVIFNGITFPVALPVQTELTWRAYRFGYEWDFLYHDRGFLGVVLEAKYTDVSATLTNIIDEEFARARAPIPAIGAIGRVYVIRNLSITGEFTAFRLPEIDEDYDARFYDFDLYGTVNFTDHVGVQGGYRSLTMFYRIVDGGETNEGDMKMRGPYFGGVLRF